MIGLERMWREAGVLPQSCALLIEESDASETSVRTYQPTWHHNQNVVVFISTTARTLNVTW